MVKMEWPKMTLKAGGTSTYWVEKHKRRTRFENEDAKSRFGYADFEVPVENSGRGLMEAVDMWVWRYRFENCRYANGNKAMGVNAFTLGKSRSRKRCVHENRMWKIFIGCTKEDLSKMVKKEHLEKREENQKCVMSQKLKEESISNREWSSKGRNKNWWSYWGSFWGMAGTNSRLMGLGSKGWLIKSRQSLWATLYTRLGRRGGRA